MITLSEEALNTNPNKSITNSKEKNSNKRNPMILYSLSIALSRLRIKWFHDSRKSKMWWKKNCHRCRKKSYIFINREFRIIDAVILLYAARKLKLETRKKCKKVKNHMQNRHYSVSLTVNGNFYSNECMRKNNCLLFSWHYNFKLHNAKWHIWNAG